jgi:chloride channel 3/4/5
LVFSCPGFSIGILTAIIGISTQWLSDIKLGYCSTQFYLNKKFCCWETGPFCFFFFFFSSPLVPPRTLLFFALPLTSNLSPAKKNK